MVAALLVVMVATVPLLGGVVEWLRDWNWALLIVPKL